MPPTQSGLSSPGVPARIQVAETADKSVTMIVLEYFMLLIHSPACDLNGHPKIKVAERKFHCAYKLRVSNAVQKSIENLAAFIQLKLPHRNTLLTPPMCRA